MSVTSLNQSNATYQTVGTQSYAYTAPQTAATNNANAYRSDSISIIPINYPTVQNNVPTSIFEEEQPVVTNNTYTQQTQTATQNTTTATVTGPATKAEINWAIELETKVQKQSYQPTQDELNKYQSVVAKIKANDTKKGGKLLSEIINTVSAQAPTLGASVGAQRVMSAVSGSFTETFNAIKTGAGTKAVLSGLKGVGVGVLKGTGISALVSGIFSGVSNGIGVFTGRITKADAAGSIAADVANGAVSGAGGALVGGVAMAGLTALGMTAGLPLTLLAGGATLLGSYLGDKLFKKTGAYDKIFNTVSGWVGGNK